MADHTKGLNAWLGLINEQEMPALAGVIKELTDKANDENCQVGDIADTILKDATVTAQVLKVANSVQFNPQGHSISTISKAIIAIGLAQIKSICMTVSLIDKLLTKNSGERLLENIAKSIHAAVQAKYLARNLAINVQEEVFIAALLFHLGEMAFLGLGGMAVLEFERKIASENMSADQLAYELIECRFSTLTKELVKEWHIGPLLLSALGNKDREFSAQAVVFGEAISQTIHFGIHSKEMNTLIKKIHHFNGEDISKIRKYIIDNAEEAASVAVTYGASQVCHLMPQELQYDQYEAVMPSADYQMNYLQELTNLALENNNINSYFQFLCKAILNSCALSRVCIALIEPQSKTLEARYVFGYPAWLNEFKLCLADHPSGAFCHVLNSNEIQHCQLSMPTTWKNSLLPLFTSNTEPSIKFGEALIAPLQIGQRKMGVIYADQQGKDISNEQFKGFELFSKQALMMLQVILSRQSQLRQTKKA
jgi:HD-like signal output (HDOD) protein